MTTAHERPAALAEDAPPRLADRLGTVRTRYFVGRAAELDLFRACLQADERPWALLYVHGPGGVGKSVLLRTFGRVAEAAGASVALLDGRDLEPSPAGFLRGLCQALGLDEHASPVDVLAGQARPVLLIDTYEQLAPLDAWLREELLPRLPSQALIVMAGRTPPSPAWRADPAWSELGRVIALRNLLPEDSRAYLSARGVPPEQHAAVLEFTHGHPLALSLLANLLLHGGGQRAASFRPEHAPDVVRVLLERFIEHVPSQLHWRALAVCAHARVTTEALLADVLGAADAPPLFEWLRELPFIEHGPLGIFPHDLAREVLDADLRWRDPPTYADLHARIRDAMVARMQSSRGLERQDAYFDLIYLVRHSSVSKAYYDWASFGHLYAEPATPGDVDEIVAMVRRHEGAASARIAEYWLGRQRSAFVAFHEPGRRDPQRSPGIAGVGPHGDPEIAMGSLPRRLAGFAAALLLDRETPEDRAADPAVAAAWDFVARHGPLRPGEALMHHRFFVGRDGYQDTATHNMVAMVATMRWLTTPRLAWCFAAVAEPERWRPMFEAIRFPRSPEADFEVGGRRYGVFTHDWRVDPPAVWIQAKVALEPPREPARALAQDVAAPLLVLSEPDFAAAVRRALRDYHRSELARNPLLRSRLALAHAGGAPTVATLQALVREAAEELRGHPRDEKLYRALALTYLEPLPTQEAAAERLGLPFNTYRYQLAAAVTRVTAWLWQRELGADAD